MYPPAYVTIYNYVWSSLCDNIQLCMVQFMWWYTIMYGPANVTIYNYVWSSFCDDIQLCMDQLMWHYTIMYRPVYVMIYNYVWPVYVTIYNYVSASLCDDIQLLTYIEVNMKCCWTVNFILTDTKRRSIWLSLLFKITSFKSTIVIW